MDRPDPHQWRIASPASLRHSTAMHVNTPEAPEWAETLIHSRRTTLPKRLGSPGPSGAQRQRILQAAAAAPDHGQLLPWRLIEVPCAERARLAGAFARALQDRDPDASAAELTQAREKAYRAPWLLLAVCQTEGGDPDILAHERLLSAGAAIQNMLLMATAMGLGSALTSGKALQSHAVRQLFRLEPTERALCFINVGTALSARAPRTRPSTQAFFTTLAPEAEH